MSAATCDLGWRLLSGAHMGLIGFSCGVVVGIGGLYIWLRYGVEE